MRSSTSAWRDDATSSNSTREKSTFVRHQFDVIDHLGLRLPHLICWDQKTDSETSAANALSSKATSPGSDISAISTVTNARCRRRTDEAGSDKRHQLKKHCASDIVRPCSHDVARNCLGART